MSTRTLPSSPADRAQRGVCRPIQCVGGWLACFAWMTLLVCLTRTSAAEVETSNVALLVGVSKYRHDHLNRRPLRYPEADAEAIAEALGGRGYKVVLLTGEEAGKTQIMERLAQVAGRGRSGGSLVLGFFGHGVQYGADAYFCPFDADMQIVRDEDGKTVYAASGKPRLRPDPETLVSMQSLLEAMQVTGASDKVLLADCCRDDPARARSVGGGAFGSSLRLEQLPTDCAAVFACRARQRAFEHDDWGHGAFSKAVLERLSSGDPVDALTLTVAVRRRVESLVGAIGETQTVHLVANGSLIDFRLRNATVPSPLEPLTNSVGMTMVPVPADSSPLHAAFHLAQTEVTQRQYRRVMASTPWANERFVEIDDSHPATHVTWDDAAEFCRRLSSREGRTYRLPTSEQWEYACRGGTQTDFYFGDSPGSLGRHEWFNDNAWSAGERYPHAVAAKEPNPWNLYDMLGNVREWCLDPKTSPVNASGRSIRGGSWIARASFCTVDAGGVDAPDTRSHSLGFRPLLMVETSD